MTNDRLWGKKSELFLTPNVIDDLLAEQPGIYQE